MLGGAAVLYQVSVPVGMHVRLRTKSETGKSLYMNHLIYKLAVHEVSCEPVSNNNEPCVKG